MDKKDGNEFGKIMMVLSETFIGIDKKISKNLIEVYFRSLSSFDIEQIKQAANELMTTWENNYLPKPAHFIKIIDGSQQDNSLLAWENVLNEIASKGIRSANFDQNTTRAINACGGIEAIGLCDIDKLDFKKRAFIENYKVINKTESRKEIQDKRLKELTRGIG